VTSPLDRILWSLTVVLATLAIAAATIGEALNRREVAGDLHDLRQRVERLELTPRTPPPAASRSRALLPERPAITPSAGPANASGEQRTPLDWPALARCESSNNPRAVSSTGRHRGAYQFTLASWHWVGMTGDPIDAPLAVQTEAARRLLARQGARAAWPYCSRFLRVRP
jgi:hypothetical protein